MRRNAVGGRGIWALGTWGVLAASSGVLVADLTQGEYEAAQAALPYAERFGYAKEALTSATDGEVTATALRDVLAASKELGKHEEALAAVDAYLAKAAEGSVG